MIAALKNKNLKRGLQKSLKVQQRNLPQEAIRSVLVLTTERSEGLSQQLENLQTELKIGDHGFAIREFTTGIKPEELKPHQWCKKDFSWNGSFTHSDAAAFKKGNYDLVIGFYKGEHLYLDRVITETTNCFRAGIAGGNALLFDLLIDTPEGDWMAFENELLKYLSILKLRA